MTAKEMLELARLTPTYKTNGVYPFNDESLKILLETICKEQRESCALKYEQELIVSRFEGGISPYHIINAKQPEV